VKYLTKLLYSNLARPVAFILVVMGLYNIYFVNRYTVIRIVLYVFPFYIDFGRLVIKSIVITLNGSIEISIGFISLYSLY
jgi:hypothetical protein